MPATSTTPAPASPPDPEPDRSGKTMPERIAFVLHAVRILLAYGRHLVDTIGHRTAAPSFTSIAKGFGTADLSVIFAHLRRGILRAIALERVLLARAASGRDIDIAADRTDATGASPDDAPAWHPPARRAVRNAAVRLPRYRHEDAADDASVLAAIEAEVRRRPIGQTVVEICLDLAVLPGFCTRELWDDLFDIIRYCGGSIDTLMLERCRRDEAFSREQDRNPIRGWDWWDDTRERVRQALGFFIGEEPVDPFSPSPAPGLPAAALATGPP